jgi:hypothetical protein
MGELSQIIESMKGLAGSGTVLGQSIKNMTEFVMTLEPGDFVRSDPPQASAAPIGYDLWYLWCANNLLAKYYTGIDGDHYDYSPYLADNMKFLNYLPGLKPVKTLRNLKALLSTTTETGFMNFKSQWSNNGVYWINTMAFEVWRTGAGYQYSSVGPKGFKANDYAGYISFPIGQLGAMEVISLMQETDLYDIESLSVSDTPSLQSTPDMFPDMKDSKGNAIGGKNMCFGDHLLESAYLKTTAADPNLELWASPIKDYGEDVKPKQWARYWIRKDGTMPVPGEFIGILCRPVSCPPQAWWFQESAPFLYAGNWIETGNLTSGIVTKVTAEVSRTDGGKGSQYNVRIQGCEVLVDASDFLVYEVDDRVAVVKVDSTATRATKSFTWLAQPTLQLKDKLTKQINYVIVPITFYEGE